MENNEKKDFDYMTEKIKPQLKRKLKKLGEYAIIAIVSGVIFGFVARFVFISSGGIVDKLLGSDSAPEQRTEENESEKRSEVNFDKTSPKENPVKQQTDKTPTGSPAGTGSPSTAPTAAPVESTSSDADARQTDQSEGDKTPADETRTGITDEQETGTPTALPDTTGDEEPGEETAELSGDETGSAAEDDQEAAEAEAIDPLAGYAAAMASMRRVANRAAEALVTVRAITSGINWLDDNIETTVEVTGVLVGDNNVEILALAEYEALAAADRIEVVFGDGAFAPAEILGRYSDLNIAVIAFRIDSIPEDTYDVLTYMALGDSSEIYEGEPIIAIGRPNGIKGAVEYGFVSTVGGKAYITDGVVDLFTTDIGFQADADGVIIDLKGEMIGLIANSAGSSGSHGVSTAIKIDSIRPVLHMLVNGHRIPYLGIRAENIPADVLAGMGIENGVYVNEVIAYSTAQNAGLRKGDVIRSLYGEPVYDMEGLMNKLLTIEPGEWVNIRIFRGSLEDDKEIILSAKISYK